MASRPLPISEPTTNVNRDRVDIMYQGQSVCKLSSMFKLIDDPENMTWVMRIEHQNDFQRFIVIEFGVVNADTLQNLENSFVFVNQEHGDDELQTKEDLGFIVVGHSSSQTPIASLQESKSDLPQRINQLIVKIWLYTLPKDENIQRFHKIENKTFLHFKLPITFKNEDWKTLMNEELTQQTKQEIIKLNSETFNASPLRLLCIRLALEQFPEFLAIGCTLGSKDFTYQLKEVTNVEDKKIIANNLTLLFILLLNVLNLKIPVPKKFIHNILKIVLERRTQVISLLENLLLPNLPPKLSSYIKTIRHMVQFILL